MKAVLDNYADVYVCAVVLAEPEKYNGQTIPVVGEHISYTEMAEVISAFTGKTVK